MGLLDKFKRVEKKADNRKFPFEDSPDTACITCYHVLEGYKPILYVSHDEDG